MSSSDGGSPPSASAGLLSRIILVVGTVLAITAVVLVSYFAYLLRDYKEDNDSVDTRPVGLTTVQQAAVWMDSATVAKRPYPTVQQMISDGADWPGMEVTVLSSDSRRRAYCITAVPVVDYLGEPVRYYIHRSAGAPLEPRPRATTTPCT